MSDKIKQKHWYTVKIEGTTPIILEFRVLAENEDNAFEIVEKQPHLAQLAAPLRPDLRRMKKIKASIKNSLTGFITWTRRF